MLAMAMNAHPISSGEPSDYAAEVTVDQAAADLLVQIQNTSSPLFAGNVTVAVDPTWGLSGDGGVPREYSPHLPHQVQFGLIVVVAVIVSSD